MIAGYSIELQASTQELALLGVAISYLGKPFALMTSVLFIANFCNRKISKTFCVALLGIMAICFLPDKPLIYCGALLGAVGDYFLIENKNTLRFALGTVSFLLGHFCYIAQIGYLLLDKFPWYAYVAITFILILGEFCLYKGTYKVCQNKVVTIFGNLYIPFLIIMIGVGITLAVKFTSPLPGILVALGYTCFVISDGLLVCTTYIKDVKRRDFYIMLSYLTAEALIVFGLLLAGGFIWG